MFNHAQTKHILNMRQLDKERGEQMKASAILDEPVSIEFKEDSIPSLRRGPLDKKTKTVIIQRLREELLARLPAPFGSKEDNAHYAYGYDEAIARVETIIAEFFE